MAEVMRLCAAVCPAGGRPVSSPRSPAQGDTIIRDRRRIAAYVVACIAFAAIGLMLTANSRGNPATGWMMMFAPADFTAPGALGRFLAGLQVPIPPWLAALEILSQRRFGTVAPVTVGLYRFCLIGAYVIALLLTWPSYARLAIAFAGSVLFLWTTVLIHPATPIVYDVVLPFLLVAYFALVRVGSRGALLLAGVALALAELTRPYLLLFLPLLLVGAWCGLARGRRGRLAALLVPLLLISGAWHAHQWVNHGQLAWSNHAGFNMIRAWRMVPYPDLIPEPGGTPVAADRRNNLNTPEHAENSRRLRRAVLQHILAHPLDSAVHMLERIATFVAAGHQIEDHAPDHPVLPAYDVVVKYANLAILAAAIAVVLCVAAAPRRLGTMLGDRGNQMLLLVAGEMVLIAVTEAGEEARFQISMLPLIAALPMPFLPGHAPVAAWPARRKRQVAAAALAVIVVVEISTWGSARRAVAAATGGPLAVAHDRPASHRLRVAQFNIRGGAWRDRGRELAANSACLKDLDLVGLAEVRGPRPFGLGDGQATSLAAAVGLAALYAPSERRWWHEHFGNALLTALPIARWRRDPLPHRFGVSYRSILTAEVPFDGRIVQVLVTQLDYHDEDLQIEAVNRAFRAAPAPALLLVDFGPTDPRKEPPHVLVSDPAFLALTNQPPLPEAPVQGGWILAKGFRRVDTSLCKGGVSMQPRLAATLELLP